MKQGRKVTEFQVEGPPCAKAWGRTEPVFLRRSECKLAEILEDTQVKQQLDPEGPRHVRVFGLGSEGAAKHVCRLQTARGQASLLSVMSKCHENTWDDIR